MWSLHGSTQKKILLWASARQEEGVTSAPELKDGLESSDRREWKWIEREIDRLWCEDWTNNSKNQFGCFKIKVSHFLQQILWLWHLLPCASPHHLPAGSCDWFYPIGWAEKWVRGVQDTLKGGTELRCVVCVLLRPHVRRVWLWPRSQSTPPALLFSFPITFVMEDRTTCTGNCIFDKQTLGLGHWDLRINLLL